jgi:hypothetical protein
MPALITQAGRDQYHRLRRQRVLGMLNYLMELSAKTAEDRESMPQIVKHSSKVIKQPNISETRKGPIESYFQR